LYFLLRYLFFFLEFLNNLVEYFEVFKLKDSTGKYNKGNPEEDIPSILNQDKGSSSKPENSGLGTKGSVGKSIAEDLGNYELDSDSDSDSDYDYDPSKYDSSTEDESLKAKTQQNNDINSAIEITCLNLRQN
jgi:hypothetical protein